MKFRLSLFCQTSSTIDYFCIIFAFLQFMSPLFFVLLLDIYTLTLLNTSLLLPKSTQSIELHLFQKWRAG